MVPVHLPEKSAEGCEEFGADALEKGSVHKELGGKLHFALSDIGNWGLVLHFFCDGFVGGGWVDLWHSVLGGYLSLPSNLIKGCGNLALLPVSFSAVLGMLSDSRPIFGFRRRPYMAGGWFLSALSTLYLVYRGLPAPYFCFENGHYLYQMPPCNPEAADRFVPLVLCISCSCVGAVMANAAANGLLVEYAKQEEVERRGRTQIVLQMVRLGGHLTSVLLSAFGFNGRMFNGSFEQARQLNFQQLMGIYLTCVAVTSVCCLFLVRENKAVRSSFREQMSSVWNLTQSKAFLFVGIFVFLRTSIGHMSSTAEVWVMMEWAEVRGIQIQMSNALSLLISLATSYLMRRYLLNVSWRKIIFITSSVSTAADSIPSLLTVFDLVRNPYFYLGEPISRAVPTAMNNLINVLMANELADDDNGAMVAGMLQSVTFVGIPFGMVVSNQLFSSFTPALTLRENFIEDAVSFRWTVAYSYLVAYTFSFASLAVLPLAPAQKKQAQARKQEWPRRPSFAIMLATVLGFSFLYSLSADILLFDSKRRCMHFLGGPGSELYHFTRRADGQAPEHRAPLEPKDWALRRVRAETALAAIRQLGPSALGRPLPTLASRGTFAGARHLWDAAWRSEREARWAERERMKQREHEQAKMGKRWRWVNGRWQTKEESEAQDAKIELVYQEPLWRRG
ncbi:unnamed protein product [Symbiodinium sp. CCMP2456]|nr:unnamed protein product [Symbiodinium sp. CCMP2456]